MAAGMKNWLPLVWGPELDRPEALRANSRVGLMKDISMGSHG
jgi:hypothetical protein